MPKLGFVRFFLVFLLALFAESAFAQALSPPEGWEAYVHYYEGPHYNGPVGISKTPPNSSPYSTPSAACHAAATFSNQTKEENAPTVEGEISGGYEEDIKFPINVAGSYVATGSYDGFRCQLQTTPRDIRVSVFGWNAYAPVLIAFKCPGSTVGTFFDGQFLCGKGGPVKGGPDNDKTDKPNNCAAGDAPLTNPKQIQVGNPICVATGDKIEAAQDYTTEDGLFAVQRSYRSSTRGSTTTTSTPGFGRNWRGLLPGRLVAKGIDSAGQTYFTSVEYQSADGSSKKFGRNFWTFSTSEETRLKLAVVTPPTGSGSEFFEGSVPAINAQGDLKLSFANGDYTLFSRVGTYNREGRYRVMMPVERGFVNGYKIWFDYPDAGEYPDKIRDSLNREMSLTWEDIGWSSAKIFGLRKGPSTTVPSSGSIREKAISTILLPDNTTVNYRYEASELSGYKGRLENVSRKNVAGDILWSQNYLYEDARFPYAITGKTDKNGERLSTYAYDADGQARLSELDGGFDRQQVVYGQEIEETDPETEEVSAVAENMVINALGRTTRYKFITGSQGLEGGTQPLNGPARIKLVVGQATGNLPEDTLKIGYTSGQTASATNANGETTTQTLDIQNRRPDKITDANDTDTNITWHPTLDLPTRTVRKRLQEDYGYDADGQLTSVSQTDLDSSEVRTVTFQMGVAGRVEQINGPRAPDAQGRDDTSIMHYDAQGNRETMTNALGHVTRYQDFDANGRPGRIIDPNGTATILDYDDLGRTKTITVTHPGDAAQDASTNIDYDIEGRVKAITRPDTARINFDYNLAGLMTAVYSDDGERIDYTHDLMGNVLSETIKRSNGSQARKIERTFDEIGRLLSIAYGPGRLHQFGYDKVGNIKRITTARGGIYLNEFDALNRLIESEAPDEGLFSNYYDGDSHTQIVNGLPTPTPVTSPGSSAANELGVFEDGNGAKTRFVRNAFGQVTQEISADRGTILYEYDTAGDVRAMTDGRGQRIEYVRDALGRVLSATPTGRPASEIIRYIYDDALIGPYQTGRLSRMIDSSGTTTFLYDHRGNLLSRRQPLGSDSAKLAYTYDRADRVVEIRYPSGRLVQYQRDSKGRVLAVRTKANFGDTGWTTVAGGMTYDPFGSLNYTSLGNTLTMSINRGNDGRLAWRRLKTATGSNLSWLHYSYDNDDNITGINDAVTPANSMAYGYDAVGRLTRVTAASGPVRRTDFAFDGNGNRTAKLTRALPTDPDSAALVESYATDERSNQLDGIASPDGSRSFVYDGRGNLASETRSNGPLGGISVSAGYDGHGRLTGYSRTGDASLTHSYNGLGDRIATTTTPSVGSADARRFVYAPDGRVLDGAVGVAEQQLTPTQRT